MAKNAQLFMNQTWMCLLLLLFSQKSEYEYLNMWLTTLECVHYGP